MLNVDTLGRFVRVFDGLCAVTTAANLVKLYEFHTGINRFAREPLISDHCADINNKRIFYTISALQVAAIGSLILNVCLFNAATFQVSGILLQVGFFTIIAYQSALEKSLMPFVRHIKNDHEFSPYEINPSGAFCGVNSFNAFIIRERNRVTREEIHTV
jgi:hypothetical protein